jgi:hypothetical protein
VGSGWFSGIIQDPLRLLGRESLGDNEKRRRDGKGQRKNRRCLKGMYSTQER